eukprot:3641081-Rhodomonas_salina.2
MPTPRPDRRSPPDHRQFSSRHCTANGGRACRSDARRSGAWRPRFERRTGGNTCSARPRHNRPATTRGAGCQTDISSPQSHSRDPVPHRAPLGLCPDFSISVEARPRLALVSAEQRHRTAEAAGDACSLAISARSSRSLTVFMPTSQNWSFHEPCQFYAPHGQLTTQQCR